MRRNETNDGEPLEDGHSWPGRVVKLDVLKVDDSLDVVRSEALVAERVDLGHSVHRLPQLGRSSSRVSDRLDLGVEHGERETGDQDREEHVDDLSGVGSALRKRKGSRRSDTSSAVTSDQFEFRLT